MRGAGPHSSVSAQSSALPGGLRICFFSVEQIFLDPHEAEKEQRSNCMTQHNTKLFASAFANLNIQMYTN